MEGQKPRFDVERSEIVQSVNGKSESPQRRNRAAAPREAARDDLQIGAFGELIADPLAEDEYERVITTIAIDQLRDLLSGLSDREREVLRARYGLDSPDESLRQIARRLGVSAERVRHVETRALGKLRAAAAESADAARQRAWSAGIWLDTRPKSPICRPVDTYRTIRQRSAVEPGVRSGDQAATAVTRTGAPLRDRRARGALGARSRPPRRDPGRSCAARPRRAARRPARCVLPRAGRG